MHLPELKVTVFSDYICPFCYVGHHRLMRLGDSYDLRINWCFVEIHPETSPLGEPVAELDYSTDYWDMLMINLKRVAKEENIPLPEHTFTTNSRDALTLAESCKQLGRETFYQLHQSLFTAFFVHGDNIGDRTILKKIANQCGINNQTIDDAWNDEVAKKRLLDNFNIARRYNIQSVPSFVFGERVLTGVVSENVMREAAAELANTGTTV